MTRPVKLGLSSVTCLVLSVLPPYSDWKQPVNAVLITLSLVLAYLATRTGSKLWWAVPMVIATMIFWFIWVAAHSY